MEHTVIDSNQVMHAHNAMVDEYDHIEDLWYSHLFDRIHNFIVENLPRRTDDTALDVGCGTGFQSILLAHAGFKVHGFDLAERLVDLARQKAASMDSAKPFYSSSLPGVELGQIKTLMAASRLRSGLVVRPQFSVLNAVSSESYLPGQFGVVSCCGSVLSFVDQYEDVLALMAGSLRIGGTLFLEVEQRLNFDLLWPLVDAAFLGRLHFDQSFKHSVYNLFTKPGENIRVNFPFVLSSGLETTLPLRLFSVGALSKTFAKLGLVDRAHIGVHSFTNLIPSTILHNQHPGKMLRSAFRPLAAIEKQLSSSWPFWRLGCSVVYALEKIR